MQYRFVPYLWVSLALAIILMILIRFSCKRCSQKGVPYFLAALVLSFLWIVAQAMEIAAVALPTKIIWANIVYIPSTLGPVFYFFLALHFLRKDKWLEKRWLVAALLIIPILYNLLLWTNDYHGLIRQNVHLDISGPFSVVGKTYGPLFWIYAAYNLTITLVTLTILHKGLRVLKNRMQKAQVFSLFLGLLLPAISVCVYISKVIPLRIDPTPIMIGFSSMIIFWGILRYHLFDIVSIAHSMVIKEMSTGIIILDIEGAVLEINPAAQSLLKLSPKKLSGKSVDTLLSAYPRMLEAYQNQTNCKNEIYIKNKSGFNYCEVTFKQLTNSRVTPIGWIFQIYDVTQRKLEEEKIKELAMHDSLTGLINRAYFEKMFLSSLKVSEKAGSSFAVAYLDLDDFKLMNDTFGHNAGDVLLRKVADALKTVLKGSAIVSRYGGDEFAILFPAVENRAVLNCFAESISEEFENHIEYNGKHIPIRTSIGFGVFPEDGNDMDMLLKKADGNMYEMKRTKKENLNLQPKLEQSLI